MNGPPEMAAPISAAEIVRIFMRPSCRRHGFGSAMIKQLSGEAEASVDKIIRLAIDGVFMESAHRIQQHAGF